MVQMLFSTAPQAKFTITILNTGLTSSIAVLILSFRNRGSSGGITSFSVSR